MKDNSTDSVITKSEFGVLPDGRKVYQYILKNNNGLEMKVINYGGIITSFKVPDKYGSFENIVLGFDNLEQYLGNHPYFGALIGRYANRISKGKFQLGEREYILSQNNGVNHLHGGNDGLHRRYWDIKPEQTERGPSLILTYLSVDMEEGYPGNINFNVRYTLSDNDELIVDYGAETDKHTILNMTQHSYFNLSGGNSDSILGHNLKINAKFYLPVDSTLIPTGELRPVVNTPFDFNKPTPIGARINDKNEQLSIGLGYDHCWVLKEENSDELKELGELYDPESGRLMSVMTTEPGVQFYSGNFLDGTITGINGKNYGYRYAVCLETEKFPDSPNQPSFPSSEISPDNNYKSTTVFKFSVK